VIELDKPVRVFKNLKHGCYSILQNGRVRASARQVRLGDVEFRVREAGRQRMIREQRRNVHAFAVGKLLDFVHPDESRVLEDFPGRSAIYNPYRFASFVDRETNDPVVHTPLAQFDERGVLYTPIA
jgi:hypothetical protein